MIRQLFAGLWGRGAVIVATSNRPPGHLYHNGLQRAAFLPFIHQLEERSHVHSLEESTTDYRLLKVRDGRSRELLCTTQLVVIGDMITREILLS